MLISSVGKLLVFSIHSITLMTEGIQGLHYRTIAKLLEGPNGHRHPTDNCAVHRKVSVHFKTSTEDCQILKLGFSHFLFFFCLYFSLLLECILTFMSMIIVFKKIFTRILEILSKGADLASLGFETEEEKAPLVKIFK